MKWLGTITTSVITTLVTVWFSEGFVQIVPSPALLSLRVKNALSATPSRTDESFRIVLCWLENDWTGEDTRNVEDAFSGVAGITLVVSDEDISASGAADEWRPAMQRGAVRGTGKMERRCGDRRHGEKIWRGAGTMGSCRARARGRLFGRTGTTRWKGRHSARTFTRTSEPSSP